MPCFSRDYRRHLLPDLVDSRLATFPAHACNCSGVVSWTDATGSGPQTTLWLEYDTYSLLRYHDYRFLCHSVCRRDRDRSVIVMHVHDTLSKLLCRLNFIREQFLWLGRAFREPIPFGKLLPRAAFVVIFTAFWILIADGSSTLKLGIVIRGCIYCYC